MVFCLLIFLDFLHGEEQQGGRRETRRMGERKQGRVSRSRECWVE